MVKKTTTETEADALVDELAQCRAELLAVQRQYDATLIAEQEQRSVIYNQENHIKSLEASEKKYVEAAAKLVETTKERNEHIEKIGALRRCAYNSSKLIKVAIQTLESARELTD